MTSSDRATRESHRAGERRALQALRRVHRLVLRERQAARILDGACRELIDALGFESAWCVVWGEDAGLALGSELVPADAREIVAHGIGPEQAEAEARGALEGAPAAAGALVAPLRFDDRNYGAIGGTLGAAGLVEGFAEELFGDVVAVVACALDALRSSRLHALSLQRERDQHALALEASGQGAFDVDPRTGRISASPEYFAILGFEPGEQVESTEAWAARTHPDDRDAAGSALLAALTGENDVFRYQCRQRTKSGQWRWVLSQGRVVERAPDGEPARLIGTISDVSAQKAAEDRQHERELLLTEAQRIARLGYWVLDHLSGELRWSDETYEIFGADPRELAPSYQVFLDAVHPDDRARVAAAYEGSLAQPSQEYAIEHRLVRVDTGETRHVFERCMHQRDHSGRVVRSIGVVQDITERVEATHKLEAVTAELRAANDELEARVAQRTKELERQAAALDATLEAVGIHLDGRWVYRNEAFHELFGVIDEWQPWRSLFSDESAAAMPSESARAAGIWTGHAEARGAKGSSFEADVEMSRLADGSTVLVVRDVTGHMRALRGLAEREARYRGLMEGSGDAILTATVDGRIMEANRRAELLLGYSPEALAGMTLEQLLAPESDEGSTTVFARMATGQTRSQSDVPLRREDGTTLFVDVSASVVALEPVPLLVTSLHDATARRAAERKRVELGEQLEMSLEAGKIGRWSYDLRTGVLEWDARMFTLYGLRPDAFVPTYTAWQELVVPADRERLHQDFQRAVAEAASFDARFDARSADGAQITIQTKAMILSDAGGAPERVFGINYDISAMVERERKLEQLNRQLELATRQKDEFLANMSHELRTPLNGILGMSESLEMGVYGKLSERQRQALSRVEDSGRHLLSLINDVLDLAKIDAGKVELTVETVRVAELGASALQLIESAAESKGITLSSRFDRDATAISADPRRLRQILLNLLSNAVKFTAPGGRVSLATEADPQRGRLLFHVTDTGEGIALEAQARLFKPFSQLDSTLTKRHGGTGLGLSIVKRLVELHGGEVELHSSPGSGSRFTVALPWVAQRSDAPLEPEGRPTSWPPPGAATSSAAARILVVEDSETNIELLEDFLRSEGYVVEVARTGREGVERATAEPFDLILMDVQMPEMDGFEATRRIRRLEAHRTTPIIALTSFAMPGDRDKCLAAGMSDYMAKPLSLRGLKQLIQAHLQHPGGE